MRAIDPASSGGSRVGNSGFQTHVAGASPADQLHSFTAQSKTILKCKGFFFFLNKPICTMQLVWKLLYL